jgi:hypothetical protein
MTGSQDSSKRVWINMIFTNKIFGSVVLVAALAFSNIALAEDSSGMVVASRGEVIALSNGGSRELKQGGFVYVNDEILTSSRSFAVLQFTDGAKVTVRPDSTLIIEQYLYVGNENDQATLNLVSGGLRVITGAMAKSNPENYKVRTPVALMGVRGTEFSIMLCGEDVCDQDGLELD